MPALSPRLRGALLSSAPFLLYLCLSVALIGRPVIGHLGSTTMGAGGDPAAYTWFLKWWPQALAHGWDPLHSAVLWAPSGTNLTWSTSIPGPSLLLTPLTELAGPIVSYNVLVLVAPALSGWGTFMLCRASGADYLPSVAGGYILAFSTYTMGHASAHPNFSLVAPVPLAAYLVVRFVREQLSPRWFVATLTALLTFEFLVSTEVFLTLALVATAVLGLALLIYRDRRARLLRALLLTVVAYLITGVLVSPYLYAALSDPNTISSVNPFLLSLDPLSLVVPTELTSVGGTLLKPVSTRFSAGPGELGGYLGLALLAVLALYGWERRRERATALLLGAFAIAVLLAMGPRLNLLGHITPIRLPWAPFIHLPITKVVVPVRIMMYAWVAVAVVVALWLSGKHSRWRWALVALGAISILPNTSYLDPVRQVPFWHSDRGTPEFFTDDPAPAMLGNDPNVLVLPYGWAGDGNDMLWQAEADMSFRMPEAYLGATIPPEFLCWPAVGYMLSSEYPAAERRDFLAFLAAKKVDAVVVSDEEVRAATPFLAALGPPRITGGVRVYRVPRRLPNATPPACQDQQAAG